MPLLVVIPSECILLNTRRVSVRTGKVWKSKHVGINTTPSLHPRRLSGSSGSWGRGRGGSGGRLGADLLLGFGGSLLLLANELLHELANLLAKSTEAGLFREGLSGGSGVLGSILVLENIVLGDSHFVGLVELKRKSG